MNFKFKILNQTRNSNFKIQLKFEIKNLKLAIYSLFLGLLIFIPQTAGAVETEFDGVSNVTEYVSKIIDWLLPIIGGLAVLIMIYAGYIYITSQGNPEAIGKAKDLIVGTLTGIVLLFLIKLILSQIGVK